MYIFYGGYVHVFSISFEFVLKKQCMRCDMVSHENVLAFCSVLSVVGLENNYFMQHDHDND